MKSQNQYHDFMTLPQAAEASGLSPWTLRRWKAERLLTPSAYSGSRPYFTLNDVREAGKKSVAQARTVEQALAAIK